MTEVMSVGSIEYPPKSHKLECELVTFTESDAVGITFPHQDLLVITAGIAHCEVARVFLEWGSLVNIIFLDVFKKLGVSESLLHRQCLALVSFGRGHI